MYKSKKYTGGDNDIDLLFRLIKENKIDDIKLLLKNNKNIINNKIDGMTALHMASMVGNIELIKVLINNGADINITDEDNLSSADYMVNFIDKDLIDVLKKNNVDINIILQKINEYGDKINISDDVINYLKEQLLLSKKKKYIRKKYTKKLDVPKKSTKWMNICRSLDENFDLNELEIMYKGYGINIISDYKNMSKMQKKRYLCAELSKRLQSKRDNAITSDIDVLISRRLELCGKIGDEFALDELKIIAQYMGIKDNSNHQQLCKEISRRIESIGKLVSKFKDKYELDKLLKDVSSVNINDSTEIFLNKASKYWIESQKNYINNMDQENKDIITLYTKNGDVVINMYYRNVNINEIIEYIKTHEDTFSDFIKTIDEDNVKHFLQEFGYKLNKLILNAPKTIVDIIVFRGNKNREHFDGLKNNIYITKGILSTTLNWYVAESYGDKSSGDNYINVIKIPKGYQCLYISEISEFASESEIILPNNSKLYIVQEFKPKYFNADRFHGTNQFINNPRLINDIRNIEKQQGKYGNIISIKYSDNNEFTKLWMDAGYTANTTNARITSYYINDIVLLKL